MNRNRMMQFALIVSLAFASSALFAQNTVTVTSGTTNVALCSTFLDALGSLNITAGVVYPTVLNGTTVNFPIGSGAIDLDTALGNIDHQGGLTLTEGKTVVAIQDFIIDTTGKSPVITGIAVVDGGLVGRIVLFDLAFPSSFKTPLKLIDKTFLQLNKVTVTLDAAAASTLNTEFNTKGFTAGLSVGTATVSALGI
jgi:hypothetical protein